MSFKCAPQIIGLVRGEPKPGQKHRANGRAIVAEMGSERISASETLDRTLSPKNIYEGDTPSGLTTWDTMEQKANEYKTTFTDKNGREHSRSLKSDAVVGFAVIFNPPYEECKDWTDEQYQKFYDDSWEILCEIEPRVFSDKNIRLKAEHWDEGVKDDSGKFDRHQHRAGEALDENEKYCGTLIDAKLLATINKKYPKMMREKGWDMEDLDTTDWDKYKTDDEYKAERKAKRKQSGKSVNKYIKDKFDKQLEELQISTDELASLKKMVDDLADNLSLEKEQLEKDKKDFKIREEKLKQQESDLCIRELQQHSAEISLMIREKGVEQLEKEQQKKADDFQHKEDAFEAQKLAYEAKQSEYEKAHSAELEKLRDLQNHAFKARLQYESLYDEVHPKLQRGMEKIRESRSEQERRALSHFQDMEETQSASMDMEI